MATVPPPTTSGAATATTVMPELNIASFSSLFTNLVCHPHQGYNSQLLVTNTATAMIPDASCSLIATVCANFLLSCCNCGTRHMNLATGILTNG